MKERDERERAGERDREREIGRERAGEREVVIRVRPRER